MIVRSALYYAHYQCFVIIAIFSSRKRAPGQKNRAVKVNRSNGNLGSLPETAISVWTIAYVSECSVMFISYISIHSLHQEHKTCSWCRDSYKIW